MDNINSSLSAKNIIVCGGSSEERSKVIQQIDSSFKKFVLPEHLKTTDRYVQAAKAKFPLAPSTTKSISDMSYDQVMDVHLNWTTGQGKVCVILPEMSAYYKSSDIRFFELITDYLIASMSSDQPSDMFRFVISLKGSPKDLLKTLQNHLESRDQMYKDKKYQVEKHVAILELS